MSASRLRSPGYLLLAIAVAGAGVMSMMTSAFESGLKAIIAEARLLADEGWIMGGTADPTPDSAYLDSVESLYLSQDSGYTFYPLTTPEQFCPIVCSSTEPYLTFGESLNQGVNDLDSTIVPAL
ncbi:hypothetical protein [Candidatus Mycobacterium methanotrophicum]|uniref:DUF732 domain-containing protein n=1 Tax=Candidatus Mycobacterium methanotrophicum TaxID=2943498 RepID=A0ABY4QN76_9MYCO|nr:hypothetical protein [Candidatus Mycobacterium methanotrophicum]UQX12329.1 hypothetical protein M5I08_08765 [Candidatus Mycobacterium methanotrophicum]